MAQQDEIPQSIISTILRELSEIKALVKEKQEIETSNWLDEETAQKRLKAKATKLWQLRAYGLIKSSKVGRKTFYSAESIEKYLKSNAR